MGCPQGDYKAKYLEQEIKEEDIEREKRDEDGESGESRNDCLCKYSMDSLSSFLSVTRWKVGTEVEKHM